MPQHDIEEEMLKYSRRFGQKFSMTNGISKKQSPKII